MKMYLRFDAVDVICFDEDNKIMILEINMQRLCLLIIRRKYAKVIFIRRQDLINYLRKKYNISCLSSLSGKIIIDMVNSNLLVSTFL